MLLHGVKPRIYVRLYWEHVGLKQLRPRASAARLEATTWNLLGQLVEGHRKQFRTLLRGANLCLSVRLNWKRSWFKVIEGRRKQLRTLLRGAKLRIYVHLYWKHAGVKQLRPRGHRRSSEMVAHASARFKTLNMRPLVLEARRGKAAKAARKCGEVRSDYSEPTGPRASAVHWGAQGAGAGVTKEEHIKDNKRMLGLARPGFWLEAGPCTSLHWSNERTPVVIFLSDGWSEISDECIYDICRAASNRGKPLLFHAIAFGQSFITSALSYVVEKIPRRSSLTRMVDIAEEVQKTVPEGVLTVNIPSSFTTALDPICLTTTFQGNWAAGRFTLGKTGVREHLIQLQLASQIQFLFITTQGTTAPPSQADCWHAPELRMNSKRRAFLRVTVPAPAQGT
ncbi:hypothetical protein EDB84DRAFT_1678554 [Lactarius hengduanensis]|nr:hypothetical protein EDB84DRAFT_1678554 [Lactarius hengduanensis]